MIEARRRLGDFQGAFQALEQVDELKRQQSLGKIRNEIGSLRLLMKLEREEHEREIQRMKGEQVERELGNTTLQLLAQTELLRDLRNDLLKIARKIPPSEPASRELRDRIKNLPCESVDWEKFDRQFKAVHPDFIRTLTERAPDLTATEVRICTMLRMNLKSQEMAQIFCISEAGVEFHRANIRRKLGLKREEKLPIVLGAM
jgi:DNA-binding CsgD family transcriptional regulator